MCGVSLESRGRRILFGFSHRLKVVVLGWPMGGGNAGHWRPARPAKNILLWPVLVTMAACAAVALARQATPTSFGKGPQLWFCGRTTVRGDAHLMESDPISPAFPLCLFARMPAHCRCRFAGPRSRVRERNTESGTISKPMLAAEDVARPNRHATAGIWDHQVPVLLAPPWTRPAAFRHAFQVDRVDVEVDLSPEPGGWALTSMRSTILRRPRYCGSPSTTRKLGS